MTRHRRIKKRSDHTWTWRPPGNVEIALRRGDHKVRDFVTREFGRKKVPKGVYIDNNLGTVGATMKTYTDRLVTVVKAMADVGVITAEELKAARLFVHDEVDKVQKMAEERLSVYDAGDRIIESVRGSRDTTGIVKLFSELEALLEVGVIDSFRHESARRYVKGHREEVEGMLVTDKVSDVADAVVQLSDVTSSHRQKDNTDMATKKAKKGQAKKGKARSARAAGGEGKPRESVANYIRAELAKQGAEADSKRIAAKAAEKFPGKKPTPGYVNWIREHAPAVVTTKTESAAAEA